MRKYLLPKEGKFYKANLHAHSTQSDGRQTPEELKARYKENGYSIFALSDHDFLRYNGDLSDEDFLMLTAYEISVRDYDSQTPGAIRKIVDLNFFARNPDNRTLIGYHPDTVQWLVNRGKISQQTVDNATYAGELRELHYSPSIVNSIIRCANENGYLVSINHPTWSLINYSDYSQYEGAWAVEVFNNHCAVDGLGDSEHVFEEMLRLGKPIFATATDDNHFLHETLGGFTMIKAEKLEYNSVISAMEKGNFYASTGPEIYDLYYEDGNVYIECSPAKKISMLTIGRHRGARIAEPGATVTNAVFKVTPDQHGYVRFRVTDCEGNNAWTNAYYVDEMDENAQVLRVLPPDEH